MLYVVHLCELVCRIVSLAEKLPWHVQRIFQKMMAVVCFILPFSPSVLLPLILFRGSKKKKRKRKCENHYLSLERTRENKSVKINIVKGKALLGSASNASLNKIFDQDFYVGMMGGLT